MAKVTNKQLEFGMRTWKAVIWKGAKVEPMGDGSNPPFYWVSPSNFAPGTMNRTAAELFGFKVEPEDVEQVMDQVWDQVRDQVWDQVDVSGASAD